MILNRTFILFLIFNFHFFFHEHLKSNFVAEHYGTQIVN